MMMLLVLLESSHTVVLTPAAIVASPGLRLGSCFVGSCAVVSGSGLGLQRDWHGLPAGSRDSSSGSKEPIKMSHFQICMLLLFTEPVAYLTKKATY
jgi:hypothetical protein